MLTSTGGVIDELAEDIHAINKEKGFWSGILSPDNPLIVAAKIALIQSEPSEALAEDRMLLPDGHRVDGILEELADTVIRCLDLAEFLAGDRSFGKILMDKVEANRHRPPNHGKRY